MKYAHLFSCHFLIYGGSLQLEISPNRSSLCPKWRSVNLTDIFSTPKFAEFLIIQAISCPKLYWSIEWTNHIQLSSRTFYMLNIFSRINILVKIFMLVLDEKPYIKILNISDWWVWNLHTRAHILYSMADPSIVENI